MNPKNKISEAELAGIIEPSSEKDERNKVQEVCHYAIEARVHTLAAGR